MAFDRNLQTNTYHKVLGFYENKFVVNPLADKRVVAIGGGTGLPSVLRALKPYTDKISAIVTVADDGGNSGQLRRDYDVLPPGDIRNNIVALADDEDFIAKLFQYRFEGGNLQGYAFGNIFLAALSQTLDDGMIGALSQIKSLLNLKGQVIPATLDKVNLAADVRLSDGSLQHVIGESQIPLAGGQIEELYLNPQGVIACEEAIHEIEQAELIILGPGSLFTSVLPNLLIPQITQALRNSKAHKVYICNIATQKGETDSFDLGNHIQVIEKYIGKNSIDSIVANNYMPEIIEDTTNFVMPTSSTTRLDEYNIIYGDLINEQKQWCHDEHKIANLLMQSLCYSDDLSYRH